MQDKNFWIPFFIILVVSLSGIIVFRYPASIVALLLLVFIIIYIIQRKTNNDWGKMFVLGIPVSLIFVVLLMIMFYFSKNNDLLWKIITWPSSQRIL